MNRAAAAAAVIAILGSGGLGGIVADYRATLTHEASLADARARLEITLADERARIEIANAATADALKTLAGQYQISLAGYRELCRID